MRETPPSGSGRHHFRRYPNRRALGRAQDELRRLGWAVIDCVPMAPQAPSGWRCAWPGAWMAWLLRRPAGYFVTIRPVSPSGNSPFPSQGA